MVADKSHFVSARGGSRLTFRLERASARNFPAGGTEGPRRLMMMFAAWMSIAACLGGCAAPAVHQHRLVAKAGMTFADSATFAYNSPRLFYQLAPGFAGSSGNQNSGCTSCR